MAELYVSMSAIASRPHALDDLFSLAMAGGLASGVELEFLRFRVSFHHPVVRTPDEPMEAHKQLTSSDPARCDRTLRQVEQSLELAVSVAGFPGASYCPHLVVPAPSKVQNGRDLVQPAGSPATAAA